MSVTREEILN